ncbi:hypothetical protein C8E02_0988 [Vogesella indigofera]|uniref:Uncharacterized protein n=1 Tax=Vogesella indigofera TaxID=45465 RepID=A0A495BK01_VOGIN|nr:hypothetical protein [Vogesella indigofera]RKQ61221.1 hypothetical protein C8E02_0988 [Vogesella indigofera]
MIEPAAALQHWAKWAVDTGNWRQTCAGIEKHYANNPERYVHADDTEKRFRFKYDQRTGELVERLVNTLPDQEKLVLRARHVHFPHLADDIVARRLAMSTRSFDTTLLAATVRFGRVWRESHRVAA